MKRVLSILLALVMALGALPAAALAAEEETVVTGEENPVVTEGEEVPAAAEEDAAAATEDAAEAAAGTAEEEAAATEAAGGTEDAAAAEDNIVASGGPDNYGIASWTLTAGGTLTIMPSAGDISDSSRPWETAAPDTPVRHLVISESNKITTIGQKFRGSTTLETVTLAGSVTEIRTNAFDECSNLRTVTLSPGLTTIAQHAFRRTGLTSISLPDTVTNIGNDAFYECTALETVVLPNGGGITTIPARIFQNCTSLTTVNVPDGVEIIGSLAFCGCTSLESIQLPETVTALGSNSFSATGLKTLILPDSITQIDQHALLGNTQLTTLKLPANLKTLADNVLNDSAVTELTIPGGVTDVPGNLFAPAPKLEKLTFEEGVQTVGAYAFTQADNLKEIHIPASMTKIDDNAFPALHPDCVIYGDPGSYAEEYASKWKIPFNGQPVPGHTLSLTVRDENGGEVTEGFTVRWYAGDAEVGEGTRLTVTDTTLQYSYELTLDEPLLYDYSQPSRQEVTLAEGDATDVTAQLTPLPERTVTGRALDEDGAPIGGAKAVFTQDFGGGHTRELTETADETGVFTARIKDVPTQVRVSAPGFYDKFVAVEAKDLGDITLTAIPDSRIALTLVSVAPALRGERGEETALTSARDLTFTVTDENGPVEDFTVQYPFILFEGAAPSGTLTVAAESSTGAADSTQVVLDENGRGEATLRFVQRGKFTVELLSDAPTTLLLFDRGGSLLQTVDTEGKYTSRGLGEGTYQAALLRRTGLLKSVSSLSALEDLGLTEGTDYAVTAPFIVSDGVITDLGGVTVPALDEAKLAYTDPDRTGTTVNFTSAAVGRLITLRVEYALKPEHAGAASGLKVAVELPDGLEMQGGATADGKEVTSSQSGRTVLIPVTASAGVVRLCFLAKEPGDYHIPAYLRFTEGGAPVAQPLGSARLTASAAKLYVPATTGSKSVTASGLAQAGSSVTVYDNGEPVGTATANAAGKWSLDYQLEDRGGYACHEVYGIVKTGVASYATETAQMVYDAAYVGVSRVTMYNTAEGVEWETVFDYLHPNQGLGYYAMQQLSFSFAIEFTEKTDRVSDVKLNVFTEDGGVYSYDTTYDPDTGLYMASVSGVVPVNVGVEYLCASDSSVQYSGMSPEGVRAYFSEATQAVEDLLTPVDARMVSEDICCVTMRLGDSDVDFDVLLTPLDYRDFTQEVLEERNFLFDGETGLWYVLSVDETKAEFIFVAPGKDAFSIGAAYDLPVAEAEAEESPAMLRAAARGGTSTGTASSWERIGKEVMEKIPVPLVPSITAALDLQDISIMLNRKHTEMWEEYFNLKQLLYKYLYASCPGTMQPRMSQEDGIRALNMLSNLRQNEDYRYRYWQSMLNDVYSSKIRNALVMDVLTSGLGKIPKIIDALPPMTWLEFYFNCPVYKQISTYNVLRLTGELTELADNLIYRLDTIGDFLGDLDGYDLPTQSGFWDFTDVNGSPYYLGIKDAYDNGRVEASMLQDFILRSLTKCPEDPTPEDPEGKDRSPEDDKRVKRDPSGFVCEAVASNRLEGVTATLYYKANETDAPVQWDGADYGEKNPIATDANGVYRWDVPVGWWQVRYEKDGYESAQSEWLPVPPPQTEVNIALVSTQAPAVQSVTAYPDGVRLAFSQYLKPESVTVTVLCGGRAVSGTIAPVNAEAGFTDPGNQYASVYVFTPEEALSDAVTVRVTDAESYNGKRLTAYEAATPVTVRPTGLTAPETAIAALGGETTLTVRLQPAEAVAGKTLRVTSDMPSVIAPAAETASFGPDGTASVVVRGRLLGAAKVTFTLEGSDLPAVSTEVTVSAGAASEDRCAAVSANIPSGSTVASGTKLTLTTATRGAAIYYTLDKSCPCVTDNPARKLYTGPITLTGDVFLIAYAVKEGWEDSPTAKFEIHVTSGETPVVPPVVRPTQPGRPDEPDTPDTPDLPDPGYADVPANAWYYDAVAYAADRGLMTGTTAETFAPDAATTRAMVWTILGRLSGAEVDGGSPWYAAAQRWAVESGVSDGSDPDGRITREQLAAMLYRFAGEPDLLDSELAALSEFEDDEDVSGYAYRAMAWAVSNGIINGVDGALAPRSFATRAQVAAMLMRFCLLLDK